MAGPGGNAGDNDDDCRQWSTVRSDGLSAHNLKPTLTLQRERMQGQNEQQGDSKRMSRQVSPRSTGLNEKLQTD
jgi:hypothetical protein